MGEEGNRRVLVGGRLRSHFRYAPSVPALSDTKAWAAKILDSSQDR